MCLAIPARIEKISENQMAEVALGDTKLRISLALTPEAQVGDYVIVHTGFAISILDEEEARETLALLAEMEQAYQEGVEEESSR